MKVKCCNCGLVCEAVMGEGACPECGFHKWYSLPKEKVDRESLEMVTDLLGEAYDMAKGFLQEQEDLMRDPLKQQREAIEKQMDKMDPFHYRKECKREGLAFEILDIKDGNRIRCRKIYLNGHIEGFKGNPLVTNHILPKILALKAILGQMNKDYRDLIETYMIRGLPLDQVPLHELYIREMEGIENIKI